MFNEKFSSFVCVGDSISTVVDGFKVTARIEHDDYSGPPWQECDGHGPVSEWTTRNKAPGERVLNDDRGMRRYYDFQEAVKIAKRDEWNTPPFDTVETAGQRAVRAAEADFQALRAWCNDEWYWVGVVLSVSKGDIEIDSHAASLWSMEANYPGSDNSHLTEAANELLPEAIQEARAALARSGVALLRVGRREVATMLAALRYWQRKAVNGPSELECVPHWDTASCDGNVEPLDSSEIDTVCELMNGANWLDDDDDE